MHDEVTRFHKKFDHPTDYPLQDIDTDGIDTVAGVLRALAGSIQATAELRYREAGDPGLYRLWLTIEELAEVAEALAAKDLESLAKELGDLSYTTAGTSVTFGLPLEEVIEEIHMSNMSKGAKWKDDPDYKGPTYIRPNIAAILKGDLP